MSLKIFILWEIFIFGHWNALVTSMWHKKMLSQIVLVTSFVFLVTILCVTKSPISYSDYLELKFRLKLSFSHGEIIQKPLKHYLFWA